MTLEPTVGGATSGSRVARKSYWCGHCNKFVSKTVYYQHKGKTTPLILVPGLMVMKKPTRSLRTLNCQMMKVSSFRTSPSWLLLLCIIIMYLLPFFYMHGILFSYRMHGRSRAYCR